MIDIKPPEYEPFEGTEEIVTEKQDRENFKKLEEDVMKLMSRGRIENELHELNKTLKEILREMRKRKV